MHSVLDIRHGSSDTQLPIRRRRSFDSLPLLSTLPLALVHSIFEYATSKPTTLATFAEVSHEWREIVGHLTGTMKLRKFEIDAKELEKAESSRPAQLELRRRLILRRRCLQRLVIDSRLVSPDDPFEWRTLFAHAPVLETLACTRLPYGSSPTLAVSLVAAAARFCPRSQSLRLPKSKSHRSAKALLTVLVESLPTWELHGGLHELLLYMPLAALSKPTERATQFITSLAKYCARLEVIGTSGVLAYDAITTKERWLIDVATWERLCASCTQLTCFDWTVVPFATPFFQVFGRDAKPQLAFLTIECHCDWEWDAYFGDHPRLVSCFGAFERDLQAALLALSEPAGARRQRRVSHQ